MECAMYFRMDPRVHAGTACQGPLPVRTSTSWQAMREATGEQLRAQASLSSSSLRPPLSEIQSCSQTEPRPC
jgi:hypothetical protein